MPMGRPSARTARPSVQSPGDQLPAHPPPVEQELALEGGGGELVPRDQERAPGQVVDARPGDGRQREQVVVGRQAQLEARRAQPQVEQRPRVSHRPMVRPRGRPAQPDRTAGSPAGDLGHSRTSRPDRPRLRHTGHVRVPSTSRRRRSSPEGARGGLRAHLHRRRGGRCRLCLSRRSRPPARLPADRRPRGVDRHRRGRRSRRRGHRASRPGSCRTPAPGGSSGACRAPATRARSPWSQARPAPARSRSVFGCGTTRRPRRSSGCWPRPRAASGARSAATESGHGPDRASAMAPMWAAVVPQQPPTIVAPASATRRA